MHVLIVQPTCDKKGHYGIWTVRMCQELARMGCKVTLCTNRVYPERYLWDKRLFDIVEVDAGRYSFERFDREGIRQLVHYYGYFRNSYAITSAGLKLASEMDVDAVFLTDIEFLTASLVLKRYRKRLPLVVMHVNAANFTFERYVGSFAKKCYKVVQREVFKSTLGKEIKAIVVLGKWHEEQLRGQLGLSDDFPIEVIADAADDRPVMVARGEARKRLGIEFDGPIFLFLGILRKDKGIECLIKAVRYVKSCDLRLVIAGAAKEYSEEYLAGLVEREGVRDKVVLVPRYIKEEEMPVYYGACDAVVFPYPASYTGGSGPLMKGACTYRRPVVATDVSEMGRLVREHNIGVVTASDDPEALAEGMREFTAIGDEGIELMRRNVETMAVSNSWRVLGERYSRFYEKIVRSNDR